MKRGLLLVASLISLVPTTTYAQAQQQPPPAGASINPVFNGSGKAWLVRYGGDPSDGNKRGDIAVQVEIKPQGGSDTQFIGTIYRYDSVKVVNGKILYKKRTTKNGQLTFEGGTSAFNSQQPRKVVRFTGSRVYDDDAGTTRKLTVYGVFHAGTIVSGADKRKDDRLIITLVDVAHQMGGGDPNGETEETTPGETSVLSPTPAPKNNAAKDGEVFIAHYSFFLHPCEEEPDVDILEETDFAADPEFLSP